MQNPGYDTGLKVLLTRLTSRRLHAFVSGWLVFTKQDTAAVHIDSATRRLLL